MAVLQKVAETPDLPDPSVAHRWAGKAATARLIMNQYAVDLGDRQTESDRERDRKGHHNTYREVLRGLLSLHHAHSPVAPLLCCAASMLLCLCAVAVLRFTRIISSSRDGRLIKIEGADPHQGAEDAAAYALEVGGHGWCSSMCSRCDIITTGSLGPGVLSVGKHLCDQVGVG